ncbi:MAG: molybdopterin-guanine dinucleotide biosynthesis protein B [Gemmatimonadota bacterium]
MGESEGRALPGREVPPAVCVIGKKKSGKTTTVVGLVAELVQRGYRVMTAKHGHHFRLDTEGTDSWRHRHESGAVRTVLAGPEEFALTGVWGEGGEEPLESLVARYLSDAELVIAEGFKRAPFPRIEVYRSASHAEPIYPGGVEGADPGERPYLAILTDVPDFDAAVPVLDLHDPERFAKLADIVEAYLQGAQTPS